MNAMVVKAAERHRQTGQTSGMVREEAFHADKTWAGVAYNAPHAVSGWHHHGDHESTIHGPPENEIESFISLLRFGLSVPFSFGNAAFSRMKPLVPAPPNRSGQST